MHKFLRLTLLILGVLFSACTESEDGELSSTPTNAPSVSATLPDPEVIVEDTPVTTDTPAFADTITPSATVAIPTSEPTETPNNATPAPLPARPVNAITLEPVITEGLQQITFITHAYDERLFVLEKAGRIRIVLDGQLLPIPFLDLTDRVGSGGSEQGLLGLAFHPDYATSDAAGAGQFFVNYTDRSGDTRISRFNVLESDPNLAAPDSEVVYLTQNQPFPNHNGGSLAFGPDGYLYVGLGDGGLANDPLQAGQDLTTLLGKILRLDVSSTPDAYAIPVDNPFVGVDSVRPEIWAYGLRNPWRFSFDRLTGDMFIADVGQSQWEEVNFQPANSGGGENYGWRIMEGSQCFRANNCEQDGLALPIFEYDHSNGCSITGGYTYRGSNFPSMAGNYFVSDYCSGKIWRLFPDGDEWLADLLMESGQIISTFGEDVNGELYVAGYRNGSIYMLAPGD